MADPVNYDAVQQAMRLDPTTRATLLSNWRAARGGQLVNKALAATLLAGAAGVTGYAGLRALTAPATRKRKSVAPRDIVQQEIERLQPKEAGAPTSSPDVAGYLLRNPMAVAKIVGLLGGGAVAGSLALHAINKRNPIGPKRLAGVPLDTAVKLDKDQAVLDALLESERRLAKLSAEATIRGLEAAAVRGEPLPASHLKHAQDVVDAQPHVGPVITPAMMLAGGVGTLAGLSLLGGVLAGVKERRKRRREQARTVSRFDQLMPDKLVLVRGDDVPDAADRNVIRI